MNRLKAYHKFSIEVEFKTYADNGIILYNQQKNDGTGDFVSLAIVDGLVLRLSSKMFSEGNRYNDSVLLFCVLISRYLRDNYNGK